LKGRAGSIDAQPWVRESRLVVAALRDMYPDVDCDAVTANMVAVHQKIRDSKMLQDGGDYAARLAISFKRLVVASARARGCAVANDEDLRRALPFLKHKIDFLREHHVHLSDRPTADPLDEFLSKRTGNVVTPTELRDEYEAATGHKVDERTMRRRVQARPHQQRGKGKYLLLPKKP
jgi:hypothetical protein